MKKEGYVSYGELIADAKNQYRDGSLTLADIGDILKAAESLNRSVEVMEKVRSEVRVGIEEALIKLGMRPDAFRGHTLLSLVAMLNNKLGTSPQPADFYWNLPERTRITMTDINGRATGWEIASK